MCKGPKIDGVCPGQGEIVVTILGDSFGAKDFGGKRSG